MHQKIIFTNSKEKSNFITISPDDFIAGIHNFEYLNYSINYKKSLEKSNFKDISFLEHFNFNDNSTWWLIHERFFYAIHNFFPTIAWFRIGIASKTHCHANKLEMDKY